MSKVIYRSQELLVQRGRTTGQDEEVIVREEIDVGKSLRLFNARDGSSVISTCKDDIEGTS